MAKKLQTKIKHFTLLFQRILHSVRVPFWLLEGDELNSQSPLAILCSANEIDRNYLASLSFGKDYKETELGTHWIWNAARLSKRHAPRCGLIMIQAHPKLRKLFFSNRWFFIPVFPKVLRIHQISTTHHSITCPGRIHLDIENLSRAMARIDTCEILCIYRKKTSGE